MRTTEAALSPAKGLALATALALSGLGFYLGGETPDLDQRTSVLLHRSILTHGLLAPAVGQQVLGWPTGAAVVRGGVCSGGGSPFGG